MTFRLEIMSNNYHRLWKYFHTGRSGIWLLYGEYYPHCGGFGWSYLCKERTNCSKKWGVYYTIGADSNKEAMLKAKIYIGMMS